MSATLDYNSLKVEAIGRSCYVPNNDYAKLMYYLSCVFTVIQYDENSKFTDYEHYYLLTKDEENALIVLALLLNPKIFLDAKIFIYEPNLIPYGYTNEFYKITDERIGVHVNQEIFIAGRAVRVLKIMACSSSWLEKNFFKPMENINKGNTSYSNNNYSYNYNYNERKKCNWKCCCKWLWICMCILWIIGIIGSIINGSDSD